MSRYFRFSLLQLTMCLLIISCQSGTKERDGNAAPVLIQEATSLDGKPLYRKMVSEDDLESADELIEAFRKKQNLQESDYLELGKIYTSTNRYRDAIGVFEEGIQRFPDSYRLHRNKGHRHLSLRELRPAITHLSTADQLIGPEDNGDLEYDASGKPTGTYKYWVKYYSGVYYMLSDDLNNAIKCYQSCIDLAIDNKNTVGPSAWLYHLNQMKGNPETAQEIIDRIDEDLDTDQGHPYFKQAMLFKGVFTPEELMAARPPSAADWSVQDATVTFGVARYHVYQSDSTSYLGLIDKILSTDHWNAWAYVMAEKDRVKLQARK